MRNCQTIRTFFFTVRGVQVVLGGKALARLSRICVGGAVQSVYSAGQKSPQSGPCRPCGRYFSKDEVRILEDIASAPDADIDDAEFINRLLKEHGAEKMAGAYLALQKKEQTAPEDLRMIDWQPPQKGKTKERSDDRPQRGKHADFAQSVWVKLSVGRKQRAEPRWLIPLICNAVGIQKDIGTITMHADETMCNWMGSVLRFLLPHRVVPQCWNVMCGWRF